MRLFWRDEKWLFRLVSGLADTPMERAGEVSFCGAVTMSLTGNNGAERGIPDTGIGVSAEDRKNLIQILLL